MQEGSELKRRRAIEEAEEDSQRFFSAFRRLRWSQAPAPALAALKMTQNSLETGIAKMWRTAPVFKEAALWSIQEEADGATLAVTAAWFAIILNERPS